jgi:N-acetylneuraminate synthase
MVSFIEIAGRKVGPGYPCFIVAEAGVNHNGSPDLARQLIDVAAQAGADAVKFQAFQAPLLATSAAPKAPYQQNATAPEESQLAMLRRLELSPEVFRDLQSQCQRRGIIFMATPFDEASADLLDSLNVPVFKVPSGEITNLPFLCSLARRKRPMIVSTGMSTLDEVAAAVASIRGTGNEQIVLLHCVSSYPAAPADVNLKAMDTMARTFSVPVGYSDHTLGIEVALAAVALGACVLEKHITLDRNLPGPDHEMSLEPDELSALVRGVRSVEAALGHGRKEPAPSEADIAAVARKSLVAACDLPAGAVLSADMVAIRRPGTGIPPSMLPQVVHRRLRKAVVAGTLLSQDMLE